MSDEPFGACPECGATGEYRNIYKYHFFFCDEHRITWNPGYNLFSSWQEENSEDWRAAWEKLRGYRTVDGFGERLPGPRLEEQTTLEALLPEWANRESVSMDPPDDAGFHRSATIEQAAPRKVLAFPGGAPTDADLFDNVPINPANPHRFGDEPYPGEIRDLTNELDGARKKAGRAFGTEHPFFRLIDSALRSSDVEELRTARAAVYGMGLIW